MEVNCSEIQKYAVIGSVSVMILGLIFVWNRLHIKKQGFGDNSLKAMGLIIFFPTLIILSIVVKEFKTETLAALLGTLAGYIFSNSESGDKSPNSSPPNPSKLDPESNIPDNPLKSREY